MWQITENNAYICKKLFLFVMKFAFIILSVISLMILVAAVVILLGKGDDLIVGYNLASRKNQERYHRNRVRMIAGMMLIIISVSIPVAAVLLIKGYTELVITTLPAFLFALVTATFTLGHFWAKKKEK